jgi:MFS superfamily sulfate permease-like transporter
MIQRFVAASTPRVAAAQRAFIATILRSIHLGDQPEKEVQLSVHGGEMTGAGPGPTPKDWLPGLRENWRTDFVSGFVVFLIALPLSLGIALASGAPAIAGIITAIVGGMLVSILSGSYVTINGPAAGLIVIVLGAVEALGGFKYALAVGVVAGLIQIAMGLLRAGKITNFFPLSVVHGMLAGIGIIIASRQIHVALTGEKVEADGIEAIIKIPESIADWNPYLAVIGIGSILIMAFWPSFKKIAKVLPATLIVAATGIVLAAAFGVGDEGHYTAFGQEGETGDKFLIDLGGGLFSGFTGPDFSKILDPTSIRWIIVFAFVASLESLLTASAVEKLDPWKRRSDMNRELVGKGIGNTICGGIGGLPMIAEVVRSSANVFNGARTRWANFFHGGLILLFVGALPFVVELIPQAALAGVLVFVGYKLANPKQFVNAYRIGKDEFAMMITTTTIVVVEDLLFGVIAGCIVGLIIAVVRHGSARNLFKPAMGLVTDQVPGIVVVRFKGALGFGNFVGVRGRLDSLPQGQTVVLDFSEASFIDHTVVERLHDFEDEYVREGGNIERRGFEHLQPATEHELAALIRKPVPR